MFNFPWADLCSLQTPIIFVRLSLITSHSVAVLNWPSFLLGLRPPHPRQVASPSNSSRKTQTDHRIHHEVIPRAALYFDQYFLYPILILSYLQCQKMETIPSCSIRPKLPRHPTTSPLPEAASHRSSSMAACILSHLFVSFLYVFKHNHIPK